MAGAHAIAALADQTDDDLAAALAVFRVSAAALVAGRPATRVAAEPSPALLSAAETALSLDRPDGAAARRFFQTRFRPRPPEPGLMTGYYEPVFAGRLAPDGRFRFPLRRAPATFDALPARVAIEDGAIDDRAPPFVWFSDPLEPYLIQVQGSARVDLGDGATLRLAYAGRNGRPYTSIGRLLVADGRIPADRVDLPAIRALFAAEPDTARATMRRNDSYVFFAPLDGHDPALGPIGGQGVPLTPHRSVAVDRTIHPYGTPVFLTGRLPAADGDSALARLMIAQDTGSAILGAARIDYFFGTGAEAEACAGRTRHPVDVTILEAVS